MIRDIEKLHTLNLYENVERQGGVIESKTQGELVFEAMGLNVSEVIQLLLEVMDLTRQVAEDDQKDPDKTNRLRHAQEDKRLKVRKIFFETGLIRDLKEMEDPNFIDNLIDKHSVLIAHYSHADLFDERMIIVKSNPKIQQAYDKELRQVNLDFKTISYLHKAVKTKNQKLYDEVNRKIQTNFNKLPRAITTRNADLRFVVAGCLRRDAYFTDTHPFFDKIRADVRHPSIYISIAILSKACITLEHKTLNVSH